MKVGFRFGLVHSPVRPIGTVALITRLDHVKSTESLESVLTQHDKHSVFDYLLKLLPGHQACLDDQAVRVLCENVSVRFAACPQILLLAARCCVAAKRRGSITSLLPVYALLELMLPNLYQTPNIQVVRAIRVASNFEWTSVTDTLITEALRGARLSSYSAMDISELIHSANVMLRNCTESDVHERIEFLINSLYNEVLSRKHSINIKNEISSNRHVRAMKPQDLSLIASSNILFVLRDIKNINCRNVIRDILKSRETCEDDAFFGSSLLHLVSVSDSLLLTASSESRGDDWKVHKRILKAIYRKVGTSHVSNPFLDACVRKLDAQYGAKKDILKFIR